MKNRDVLVFGCDEYALQIAENLKDNCKSLKIYTMYEEKIPQLEAEGYEVALFDFSENWDDLAAYDSQNIFAFCALCDEAKNVFLTISLRTALKDIAIVALANDHEHAVKLKMAGANKTIVTAQIAANVISELLEKPTASDILQKMLHDNSKLKISQVSLTKESKLIGQTLGEVDFQNKYHVIVLAVLDKELQTSFVFNKKGYEHRIESQDILICIGYEEELETFKETIGEYYKTDWHHWKW